VRKCGVLAGQVVTSGPGAGHGSGRVRDHKRHGYRRSKRHPLRSPHKLLATRASLETTWRQALAPFHSERPDSDNRTRTGLWLLDGGLRECRRNGCRGRQHDGARVLNETIVVSPMSIKCKSAWTQDEMFTLRQTRVLFERQLSDCGSRCACLAIDVGRDRASH
jgi:hypothetical protein